MITQSISNSEYYSEVTLTQPKLNSTCSEYSLSGSESIEYEPGFLTVEFAYMPKGEFQMKLGK